MTRTITLEEKDFQKMQRIVSAARAFVRAVDTDEQIKQVHAVVPAEWVDLADAVIMGGGSSPNEPGEKA